MDREFKDCAVFKSVMIVSTCCPHKDIHKTTWISPDGDTSNQIDHVDCKWNRNNISDVRSNKGQIVTVIIMW
jgi:hypothetical protein